MANRAFLIHGFGGHPDEGWRPWLKTELEARDWEVTIPAMPDTDQPQQQAWVATIATIVGEPDQHTFLVGHSLGVTAILWYLESLTTGRAIGGAVFVTGPLQNHRHFPELDNFFMTPFDWAAIKQHCPRFVVIHSDNDEYVPVTDATIYAQNLHAEIAILPKMGHFSHSDGCRQLPIVRDRLLQFTQQQ